MDCGHHDEWSALRADDLREEERRALAGHRASCRRCGRVAAADRELAARIGTLVGSSTSGSGWRVGAIPGRLTAPVRAPAVVVVAVIAAAGAGAWWGTSGGRPARIPPGESSVRMYALARVESGGTDRVRPIAGGMEVEGGEALELRFIVSGHGWLSLWEEDGGRLSLVWPPPGEAWEVGAGTHRLGEPGPTRSLRPESGPGAHTYVAVLSGRPLPPEVARDLERGPGARDVRAHDRLRILWTGGGGSAPTDRAPPVVPDPGSR